MFIVPGALSETNSMIMVSTWRPGCPFSDHSKLHPGQLKVEERYLQQDLGEGTPLEYFIPTTTGPGACTFALIHFLTYIHNNFIDWCRAKSKTRFTTAKKHWSLIYYHSFLGTIGPCSVFNFWGNERSGGTL